MKRIPLTQNKFALVDDENYDWLMTWKWCLQVHHNHMYAITSNSRTHGGGTIKMHRLIMVHPMNLIIDHINHNGLDNRKVNLRTVSNRTNLSNRINPGRSKYIGVHFDRSKWRSQLQVSGKRIHLGRYDSEIEAMEAYQAYLQRL